MHGAVGRVLGIDLGTKRIGVAVCDAMRILATPLTTVARSGLTAQDHASIAKLARDEDVVAVVVGLPIDLRGEHAIAAQRAQKEIEALRKVLQVPLYEVDERMTSAQANKRLAESGKNAKQRRGLVDMAAATSILQSWLDRTM